MQLVVIIAAAVVAWVCGSLWYMVLARPWSRVSGVQVRNIGEPRKSSPMPYLISGAAMLVIASAIDMIFRIAGIATLAEGLGLGLAIGALIIAPWMLLNNTYVNRPLLLSVIDGGYAIIACAVIGAILGVTGSPAETVDVVIRSGAGG
ncbi:DUF1761 domain-containing protein [Paracoccus jeotgali]|uniref:DUF1761 domain-containing protein n=1 Tax=Paracoccus jeotgali TaxID=2065379 RepID=UPI0028B23037|nr:DUF1761 domain-containing protein [Paracoccus jeotgali]